MTLWTPPKVKRRQVQRLNNDPGSGIYKLPKSAVVGIFGPKGSGKSLLAAILAERQYQKSGRKIYFFPDTFAHIHGEAITLPEMFTGSEKLNGAVIIWDETQVLLNKFRAASHANRSLLAFLQQIRKRGAHLYFTSNARKQLDRALGEQTDRHCYVEKVADRYCERVNPKEHRADCHDYLKVSWVDTQGKAGADGRYRDQRKRRKMILPRILRFYTLYNTFASVSAEEIGRMDKDQIAAAHDELKAQIPFPEFVERMYSWVEDVVIEHAPKHLVPSAFAKFITEQTDGEVTPSAETVGRACKAMGLARRRSAGGVKYELPAKAELHLWRAGLA